MRRPLVLIVAVVTCASLAAGCGGGGSPAGVARLTPTTAASTTTGQSNGLLAFSRCMRANGVPGFPDPQHFADGSAKLTVHNRGRRPAIAAAMNACDHLLPPGPNQPTQAQLRTQLADELSFAKCMRSHGVARFPDPTAQGELSVEMVQAQGIDVHSTTVLRVVQKCLPASHGALTPAKVREAIANAGH